MKNAEPKPSTLSNTSFLEEVARVVLSEERPEDCAVVLPSYRARAAFYRACSRVTTKATRLPKAFTLSGFVVDKETRHIADELESLAVLYGVQLKNEGGHSGFESFLNWGAVALADFNAVDMCCLDAKSVFKNLKDIKDIEEWSFTKEDWSEDMIRFAEQWDRLFPLYKAFHNELDKKGQTTLAMATRKQGESATAEGYSRVFAAGLTAINEAQKRYLNKWDSQGKLEVIWDADKSYVEDEQAEAGHFVRDYKYSGAEPIRDKIGKTPPELVAVDCSSLLCACQFIREQVIQMTAEQRSKTVIVVPDATSLPVLMQSLPQQEKGYNVTMGMTLRETPVYPFVSLINRVCTRAGSNLRYEELMAIVNHPLIDEAFKEKCFKNDAQRVLHNLAEKHLVWVSNNHLKEYSNGPVFDFISDLSQLFTEDVEEYLDRLVDWSNFIADKLENSRDPWIKSGWNCYRNSIAMVLRLQESYSPCSTSNDVRAVLKRLLSTQKIDLLGEPAEGLQIMGLTETRGLDYDNVYVLDCNEGMLPKHEISDSFIPLDFKLALAMPSRYEKESTYAYSFYRLLNRSSKVHLMFKSQGTTNEGTEVSRYVLQLKSTFKPGGELLKLRNIKFSMPLPSERPTIPPLVLSDEMRYRLALWSKKGISPSALKKMVSCERNFAYRYLLKLQEKKDIQESMESNTIGSIVHYVFEEGLKEQVDKILKPHHLDAILENLDQLLEAATTKYYNTSIAKKGENLLLIESARSTIKKLINKELKEMNEPDAEEITLKGIEFSLNARYKLENGKEIGLYGLADKLEKVNGINRVVDYKTGNTKKKDLELEADFEEQFDSGKKGNAIQLLVYCAMLLKDSKEEFVSAGIRSGRNSKSGLLSLEIDGKDKITKESVTKLLRWIQYRLESISEEGRELVHNHDSNFCEYCVVLDPKKNFWD
ncbi:MAG: hypothetical protein CL847_00620 [Crocinitomicaceae bacterium]|nr:hypothetical protein [Crocinitomicaceae bacterium]